MITTTRTEKPQICAIQKLATCKVATMQANRTQPEDKNSQNYENPNKLVNSEKSSNCESHNDPIKQ
jgi:hypothetical protein